MSRSKRASYRDAIDWIAQNDSPGDDGALDANTASELVSACLVAAVWDKEPLAVGRAVVARRKRLKIGEE